MNTTHVTEPSFALKVEEAHGIRPPHDSIAAVKAVVIKELELLDNSISIRDTSYFNHTYAPDLLLSWADSSTRSVFLRFTDDLERIAADLQQIDTADPLIFGLSTPTPEAAGYGTLDASARASEAQITDVSSVERLAELQQRDAGVSLLGQALAQGGRGFIDRETAGQVAGDVSGGFSGAAELASDPTALAVATLDGYLAPPQASKMIRVLQAIWEGNEGSPDLFPGPRDLSGRLSADSLQYILDVVSADDDDFWQRIGRGLTLEQLTDLSISESNSTNFQQLVAANLDVIHARAAAVQRIAPTSDLPQTHFAGLSEEVTCPWKQTTSLHP